MQFAFFALEYAPASESSILDPRHLVPIGIYASLPLRRQASVPALSSLILTKILLGLGLTRRYLTRKIFHNCWPSSRLSISGVFFSAGKALWRESDGDTADAPGMPFLFWCHQAYIVEDGCAFMATITVSPSTIRMLFSYVHEVQLEFSRSSRRSIHPSA